MPAITKPTQRKTPPPAEAGMVAASCELPAEVHAAIAAAAAAGERSFSAQLRLIAREWAQSQPAAPAAN